MMSMAGPLGALSVGLAMSTTEFEDDVDGGPPRRHCRWVQQRPPSSFEDDIDGGALGGATGRFGSVHHQG
jgi:hypothetical protein